MARKRKRLRLMKSFPFVRFGSSSTKACKVVFMAPRRQGLGPSAVLMTRDMRSINYIDYPAGTRLSVKEKARARAELMRGCVELSRRGRGR